MFQEAVLCMAPKGGFIGRDFDTAALHLPMLSLELPEDYLVGLPNYCMSSAAACK